MVDYFYMTRQSGSGVFNFFYNIDNKASSGGNNTLSDLAYIVTVLNERNFFVQTTAQKAFVLYLIDVGQDQLTMYEQKRIRNLCQKSKSISKIPLDTALIRCANIGARLTRFFIQQKVIIHIQHNIKRCNHRVSAQQLRRPTTVLLIECISGLTDPNA